MIVPNKYVRLEESYLGISAIILEILNDNYQTIEYIWEKFDKHYAEEDLKSPSYTKFLLALDFMFLTSMINYTGKGEMYNENIKTKD